MPLVELVPVVEPRRGEPLGPVAPRATLRETERELIRRTLEECGWVVGGPNGAAARLGLKRTTLLSRMKKLGLASTGEREVSSNRH